MRWAVPKIHALEREHGSLIRGAFAPRPQGAGPRRRHDLLPGRARRAPPEARRGRSATSAPASPPSGSSRDRDGFRVETSAGPVEAARVVLAVPADAAARLLEEATAGASRLFAEIPYAAVAVVSLGWRREDVGHPLDGFGFLAPRKEGLRVLGCLFPSEIFPGRAPEGHVALAAFGGGRTDPEIVGWDDDRIASTVVAELRGPLSLRGEPAFRLVRRWPRAIPQYEVGHGRFVSAPGRSSAPSPAFASAATSWAASPCRTASRTARRWRSGSSRPADCCTAIYRCLCMLGYGEPSRFQT